MRVMARVQGPHGTRVSLLIVRRDEGSGINMPPFDLVLTRRRWITAGAATDSAAPCSSLSIAATPHSPLAAQASAMSSADDLRDMPSPTPSTNTDFERATPAFQEIVQIFKMLDKNSDGRISHAEFLGGLRRLVGLEIVCYATFPQRYRIRIQWKLESEGKIFAAGRTAPLERCATKHENSSATRPSSSMQVPVDCRQAGHTRSHTPGGSPLSLPSRTTLLGLSLFASFHLPGKPS